MRFIAAFYPDCQFQLTTVNGESGKYSFKTVGKVITEQGWRAIITPDTPDSSKEDKEDGSQILPPFTVGESGSHEPLLVKKTTQPPKYYTEATLLRAMEGAGKSVEDEDLREALKENGIGRPSTRAAIIETLFKRKYIYRQRKNIIASSAGITLIETINEELLKSPKLTGIWENRLRKIERGEYSSATFIDELKKQINDIVINVLRDNSNLYINVQDVVKESNPKKSATKKPKISEYEMIKCPKCGDGVIKKGRIAFGCSNYQVCDFRLPFTEYKDTLSPAQLATKIKKIKL